MTISQGSAILSADALYRYRLERQVQDQGPVVAFFGVNPSTADASLDDATVRKWRGFSARYGFSRFLVGNVFAYRSTDVKQLAQVGDPVGWDNAHHIARIIDDADVMVPCWGAMAKVPRELRELFSEMMARITLSGKPVRCFGMTGCGQPKHPLMLGYDTPLMTIGQALDLRFEK